MLSTSNPLNYSASKRKPGYKVKVFVDPPQFMEVPKAQVIFSVASDVLEREINDRPREFLGAFVVKALTDDDDLQYPNYGQVTGFTPAMTNGDGNDTPIMYIVHFRPLPNGTLLADKQFSEIEVCDSDVTIEQYTLGLGMGFPSNDPETDAMRYGDILGAGFNPKSKESSWIKTFKAVVLPSQPIQIISRFLQPVELDVERILGPYVGLEAMVARAQKVIHDAVTEVHVDRSLSNDFDHFNISESPAGDLKVAVINPLDLVTPTRHPVEDIPSMASRNENRRMQRVPPPIPSAVPAESKSTNDDSGFLPSYDNNALKNQLVSNSMAYRLSEAQLHRHVVTFKSGAYGKSSSAKEACEGIELLYESELLYAANGDEAQVRSTCTMGGHLHNIPFPAWRSCDFDAFSYEDQWAPRKWSKMPEVDLPDVDDFDYFWRLWNEMELAAERYYVPDYVRVLNHVKRNVTAGFMQFGGRAQFEVLAQRNRVAMLHCVLKYMRNIMQKFLTEILIPQSPMDVVTWLVPESIHGGLFSAQVSGRWQALQMRDMRAATPPTPTIRRSSPTIPPAGKPNAPTVDESEKKRNRLTKAMRAMIPPCPQGGGMCLMSYTNRGCHKDDCPWVNWYAGCPPLNVQLQNWLKEVQGSYKAP